MTWPTAPRTTNDTVCQVWVTSHRPTPPAWMTAIPLPQPVQHGWLHLLHHQHEWHQPDLAVAGGLPVVSVIPTTKSWVATGWSSTLHFLRSLYDCVPARNIAPPLLKLVISPSPSNRVKGRGAYLYPRLPPISVFLSCISKIPNLCQTALPQSDSSLTFQLSALPYLHAVPLTIWVLLCTIFSTHMLVQQLKGSRTSNPESEVLQQL